MTPQAVIRACNRRGVAIWREGEKLRYRAKPGIMTPSALASLACQKESLLPYLPTSEPPIIEGGDLTPELFAQWQEWVNRETKRIFTASGATVTGQDDAALAELPDGFPEGLYRNVCFAEWDGETHTVYCDGWPAPIITKGVKPDRERIAEYNALTELYSPLNNPNVG